MSWDSNVKTGTRKNTGTRDYREGQKDQRRSYISSLNRVEASLYSLRHTRRLMVTTVAAMKIVEAKSRRKLPSSEAWLISEERERQGFSAYAWRQRSGFLGCAFGMTCREGRRCLGTPT